MKSLSNAPQVDAVYLTLPNSLHHAWTIAALRAGKHVLCEKPIAPTAAEAREMFEVAERAGRMLVEAFMYRSHPQTLAVQKAVRNGAIGELRLIRTSFCFRTLRIPATSVSAGAGRRRTHGRGLLLRELLPAVCRQMNPSRIRPAGTTPSDAGSMSWRRA